MLVTALATFALSSGFVLTGELLAGGVPMPQAPQIPVSADVEAPVEPKLKPAKAAKKAASAPQPAEAKIQLGVPLEAVENLARELANAPPTDRRISVLGARPDIGTSMAAITLARALAAQSRVVLIDLALAKPNLVVIASDPTAPGIADLVRGTASFGQIITRDRFSRVHLITAGAANDGAAILGSQRLSITLEALARSYDFVVIDAGALPAAPPDRFRLAGPASGSCR